MESTKKINSGIMYFNDTDKPQEIYLNGLTSENYVDEVKPKDYILVNLVIADEELVFFKNWGHYVMVSTVKRSNLP